MTRRYVGQGIPRKEDPRYLTGRGQYVDNITLPATLHAVVVRSPFARARITRVDVSRAATVPGVVAAFSGSDLREDWAAPLPMIWPITDDLNVPDHWPLTFDEARYVGDGVSVVVGASRAAAEDGAEQVEVDYEPLPAAADIETALADDAPVVHPQFGTNRCYSLSYALGDVDAAFAEADVVVRRTLHVPRIIPSPMETRAVLVQPLPGGEFVLWTSTQVPHLVRRTVAPTVGVPEDALRVIVPDVGGAFGGKLNVYAEEALALALARHLDRPIKWIESRSESHQASTHGRGQVQRMELASRADGTLLAVRASLTASMGAYLQLETPGIPALGKFLCAGVYRADAYAFEVTGVFTNQTPTGAYRGVGRAEALYAIERMMDALADELDLDPAEVRRRNLLPRGEKVTNAAGIPYDSLDIEPSLDLALELAGYEELRREQARRREVGDPRQLGVGLSCYVDSCGAGPSPIMALSNYQSGAWESGRVRVLSSGRIEVLTGIVPQGQGHDTVWSQIVADVFETSPDDVKVLHGDTAVIPAGVGTFNSRGLVVGGTAVYLAAEKALSKARAMAAHLLEVAANDITFEDGRFSVAGAPDRGVSFREVVQALHLAHSLPEGMEPGLDEQIIHDPPDFTYPFGAHVAVVEVDTESGEVRLSRYVAVDDCGNVVNPTLVDGQIHGGIAQGVGQALYEEASYSEDGQLESGSLLSYLVPTAPELPSFQLGRTVTPTWVNPLGAKGAAESGAVAAPPAVMNAVVDALTPYGVRELDMPATPEKVWSALRAARR